MVQDDQRALYTYKNAIMKLITLYNLCQFFKKELEVTKGLRIKNCKQKLSQGKKVTLLL